MLDQEKAYDRVHAGYLVQGLSKFNFPSSVIHCVHRLFFGNQVHININGFFTDPILQQRGLRKGDFLSPLLFNIALEPFLLSIIQDENIQGYQPSSVHENPVLPCPPRIKCLVYADDVCALLNYQNDFNQFRSHMQTYAKVSNTKFNEDKTEAFSLNGDRDEPWHSILASMNTYTYYHRYSTEAFRYLGFYLSYTTSQRAVLENKLLSTVKEQCYLYGQRQLSIVGRVTVMNILVLSKL